MVSTTRWSRTHPLPSHGTRPSLTCFRCPSRPATSTLRYSSHTTTAILAWSRGWSRLFYKSCRWGGTIRSASHTGDIRKLTTNQNSLSRSRDWLSANHGTVFPDCRLPRHTGYSWYRCFGRLGGYCWLWFSWCLYRFRGLRAVEDWSWFWALPLLWKSKTITNGDQPFLAMDREMQTPIFSFRRKLEKLKSQSQLKPSLLPSKPCLATPVVWGFTNVKED